MSSGAQMPPITDSASPEGWTWTELDASRPRRALEHLAHSEVIPVMVDRLQRTDTPPDSEWELVREIPILVVDTFDAYWAFEKIFNKLHSIGKTKEEAKSELVSSLAGHLNLLNSLESPKMAPMLRLELEFLRVVLRLVSKPAE